MNDVTRILSAIDQGDPHAAAQLLPLVYDELRRLAAQRLAHEKPGQTIEATGLVHEAYLRLVASDRRLSGGHQPAEDALSKGREPPENAHWANRRHFFAAAAEAMRRILVENARRKKRLKHGGGRVRQCEVAELAAPQRPERLLELDEALDRLSATNRQAAELVKLRYFAGLTNADAATCLGISPRKANQVWAYARAWLLEELGDEAG